MDPQLEPTSDAKIKSSQNTPQKYNELTPLNIK